MLAAQTGLHLYHAMLHCDRRHRAVAATLPVADKINFSVEDMHLLILHSACESFTSGQIS